MSNSTNQSVLLKKISEFDELSELTGEEYVEVISPKGNAYENRKVKVSTLKSFITPNVDDVSLGIEDVGKDQDGLYVRRKGMWVPLDVNALKPILKQLGIVVSDDNSKVTFAAGDTEKTT